MAKKEEWDRQSKFVLEGLKRIESNTEKLSEKMDKMVVKQAVLDTKLNIRSTVFGAIGSLIPILIWFFINIITKQK